jgi:hypothetical protein
MIPELIQKELNEVAEVHGRKLLADVRGVFERLRRSGELLQSLELQVIKSTSKESPRILLTYADQGFFIGAKNLQWTKLPDITKLQEWAKNVQFTGRVPGYKDGVAPNLPPWKVQERKLWAIAYGKKKFDTHKPKPWKREARIGDLIKKMNTDAIEAFSQAIESILTRALETGQITS